MKNAKFYCSSNIFCTYYDLQGWTVTTKSRAIRIRKEKRKVQGKGN